MKCKNCFEVLATDAVFCFNCGKNIEEMERIAEHKIDTPQFVDDHENTGLTNVFEVESNDSIREHREKSNLNMSVFDNVALNIGTGIISIFTLGIGYPLAAAIKAKYINDRKILSNKKIEFKGTAGEIYITFIKWVILIVLTLGVYIFWIERNILRWTTENTNFKEVDNQDKDSFFDGTAGGLFVANLVQYLLIIFTFGIATSWAICYKQRYVINHTVINGQRLKFVGDGGDLFGNFIVWLLLTMVTLGIYSLWLALNVKKWVVEKTIVRTKAFEENIQVENTYEKIPLSGLEKSYIIIYALQIFLILFINIGIDLVPGTNFSRVIFVSSYYIMMLLPFIGTTLVIVSSVGYFKEKIFRPRTIVPLVISILILLYFIIPNFMMFN